MLLENRVAIVTGAATGIGRGIALKFAAEGGTVVVADIKDKEARETVRQVTSTGGRAVFIHGDVTNRQQAQDMAGSGDGKVRPHRYPGQ